MTGGEVVVAALAAHGVDLVFGIPGTHNLSVFEALTRYGVRTVATTHEQGAGYAADGYARTARRPGVAVVTSGPAVYNAATAVAQAYSDSVPLLLVSPGMPVGHPTGGPGLGYLHEAKDQSGAMARIAEECLRPTDHQAVADAVAAAFASFGRGRPRPVHLEVPLDLLDALGDARITVAQPAARPGADPVAVATAADLLSAARRPMVVAGGGAVDAADRVRLVAERLGAPVVTTINGKGVLPEGHRLALGARLHAAVVREALDRADALLVVGSELGNSDLWFGSPAPTGAVVRVDVDPRMADVNVVSEVFLGGFAQESLRQLDDHLAGLVPEPRDGEPWVGQLRADAVAASEAFGALWLPWMAALAGAVADDAVVVTDNAMCVYYGAIPNLPAHRPASFLFPTGFGTLGFTVPAAVGAALAAPDRQVVGITGDGGLLFTVPELAVAAAERLSIAVVVFDNAGYGEIRNEMLDRSEQPVAVAAPPRDLVLLAQALGAHALRVDDPAALAAELGAAQNRPGPTVLVVPEPPREA
ncbi:MAG: thiamine pyrophosphate-binding protein [Actinomycetota bacterium]|nr:thiamine pyrophosphate-binding protein [Actinomycetota bacterium]